MSGGGLHLSRVRAALYCVLLVSSHPMSVCSHRYGIFRSFTSHELFPAPGGGGRRVSACASCRDLSVADFGLLILTLPVPPAYSCAGLVITGC